MRLYRKNNHTTYTIMVTVRLKKNPDHLALPLGLGPKLKTANAAARQDQEQTVVTCRRGRDDNLRDWVLESCAKRVRARGAASHRVILWAFADVACTETYANRNPSNDRKQQNVTPRSGKSTLSSGGSATA